MKLAHLPADLWQLARNLPSGEDGEALLAFDGEHIERWRYDELGNAVAAAAARMRRWGVRPGDPVIVCGATGVQWIVSFLALLHCRACAVPVDAQFSESTFRHVLSDSGATIVLADSAAAARFARPCRDAGAQIERLEEMIETPSRPGRADAEEPEGAAPGPDDRAILFYTSGTTGQPKGVPLSHRNLMFQIESIARSKLVSPSERVLLPLPLHHVYPLVIGLLVPLALRLTVVLPDGFTGVRLIDAMRRGAVTLMIGVPRLYEALLNGIAGRFSGRGRLAALAWRIAAALLLAARRRFGWRLGRMVLAPMHKRLGPSLGTLVSGGAALSPETALMLEALGWRVGTGYGLTETSPLLTINPPGSARFQTAGKPVDGVELRIDRPDGNGRQPVPRDPQADDNGEVLAKGPGVFAGYHALPDKTSEVLTDDGWFRTGDLGRIDRDGWLHLAGRKSTLMVTAGGENVQPDEIEAAYQKHAAIGEIAVLQIDDEIKGLIFPSREARREENPEDAIRTAVSEMSRTLPSYQRIAGYRITHEALPLTRLGKPRRHLIARRYEDAGDTRKQEKNKSVGPAPIEELAGDDAALLENAGALTVYRLIAERRPDRRITPDSDIALDLGVDSVEWLNLSLEISERTGLSLSEGVVAEVETVRDLLERVVDAGEADDGVLLQQALRQPEQALDDQQRRWLEAPGPTARAVRRIVIKLNSAILFGPFRLTVEGQDKLPTKGPIVFAPNHASYLDPFALASALGRDRLGSLCWAGWTGVMLTSALRRGFARMARVLPIDPAGGAVTGLALGSAALKRGLDLVWFPEGARSRDGSIGRFRPGVGLVLNGRDVTIVPVLINGTYEAWPPTRRWPRLRPLRIRFLPAVDPGTLADEGVGENAAERIADGIRQRIVRAASGEEHSRNRLP